MSRFGLSATVAGFVCLIGSMVAAVTNGFVNGFNEPVTESWAAVMATLLASGAILVIGGLALFVVGCIRDGEW